MEFRAGRHDATLTGDLPSVVDGFGGEQMQRRIRRDEGVEVPDHLVFPVESSRPFPVYRKANHLPPIVNCVTARGYGREGPGKRSNF